MVMKVLSFMSLISDNLTKMWWFMISCKRIWVTMSIRFLYYIIVYHEFVWVKWWICLWIIYNILLICATLCEFFLISHSSVVLSAEKVNSICEIYQIRYSEVSNNIWLSFVKLALFAFSTRCLKNWTHKRNAVCCVFHTLWLNPIVYVFLCPYFHFLLMSSGRARFNLESRYRKYLV